MAIAQKLYEAGKITYMRSDAVVTAPEAQEAARNWLTAAFGTGAVPAEPPRYESKEGSQEAHEAIRPTDPAAGGEGIDPEHAPLYDLIRRGLLASQMTPARIRRTTWKLSAPRPSGQPVRLVAQGRVVVDPGFHRVLPPASLADEPPAVPDLAAGTVWAPGSAARRSPRRGRSRRRATPRRRWWPSWSRPASVAPRLCEHAQDAGRSPLRAPRRPRVRRDAAGAAGLRARLRQHFPEGH